MCTQIKLCLYAGLVVFIGALFAWGSWQYAHNRLLTNELHVAQNNYNSLTQQFQQMIKQRNQLQELDTNHTKALFDARTHLNRLSAQLADHQQRLLVHNAVISSKLSKTPGSRGVGDAAPCGLNRTGEQDYLTLLKMIVKQRQQILYLQDYAKAVSR
ncbi:hypothetical protein COMNV_00596 [Commensalibacter sp. Nvir]|uniref:lysis system i-spanin subunit Rz n=1 Tax=Commensalibacter sp. Nvir TaxID=3069817 RepID=UPI002D6AF849|nr:hypothetical protein COMNV_00596 [Commensalibacter sp. Nvir]